MVQLALDYKIAMQARMVVSLRIARGTHPRKALAAKVALAFHIAGRRRLHPKLKNKEIEASPPRPFI